MSNEGEEAVGKDDGSQADSDLQYRRLRAPKESGKSLQIPPLSHTVACWDELTRQSAADVEVNGVALATLRQQGRAELLQLATQYTQQYCDVDLGDRQNSIDRYVGASAAAVSSGRLV